MSRGNLKRCELYTILEYLCHLFCLICDYDVGSCSFYGCQEFCHNCVFVYPAVHSRCLDQRILSRNTVSAYWNMCVLSDGVYKIEVWYGRLYHDNIDSLCNICLNFTYGLSCVRERHLISTPVAEFWGGMCSIAEWSIQRRCLFCRVSHYSYVCKTCII